ncbi:MAG: iron-containing redox enzyme family protein, partial [Planctomycetes bacterium]|nr:iron-containing redox enzyme family protein [Planctomycetota bacterium]
MSTILIDNEQLPQATAEEFELSPWLSELRDEVAAHPGVNHLLLSRLRTGRYTKGDYKVFGLQHYPMVGTFTRYMELLLLRAPSSEQKLWLAKVLVDEYGEGSDGDDHAKLYLRYMRAMGVEDGEEETTPLCAAVWEFIGNHLRICREEPFLVGLGALGPGHEWAIPKMFHQIIPGLERAGMGFEERMYFDLHTEQDIDHANWMSEALEQLGQDEEARAQVRRGALLSLGARFRFWTGVERCVVARRQPHSVDAVRRGLLGRRRPDPEKSP